MKIFNSVGTVLLGTSFAQIEDEQNYEWRMGYGEPGKEKWRNFDMGYQMARTLTDQSFFKSQMKMINQQEECINFSIDFSDFRQNLNFFREIMIIDTI